MLLLFFFSVSTYYHSSWPCHWWMFVKAKKERGWEVAKDIMAALQLKKIENHHQKTNRRELGTT